jgi:hypothetical protein
MLKKKIWANFQRIVEVFTQKIFNMLSNIWVWDPGSGIRDPGSGKTLFRIPDPGVKKALDPGSRIRIRNTVCDNLPSHVSLEVISLCRENNIEYVCLPQTARTRCSPLMLESLAP